MEIFHHENLTLIQNMMACTVFTRQKQFHCQTVCSCQNIVLNDYVVIQKLLY
jgi:hypothetical protein